MTTGVYIARDAEGTVLYVGSATDIDHRVSEHRRGTPWWSTVATVEQRPVENRTLAFHVKRELIAELAPLHNRLGKNGARRISRKVGPAIKPQTVALSRVIESYGSVKQLAAAVGVDQMTMSTVWRGLADPSSSLIARLLVVTGLDFDDLFAVDPSGSPDEWLASRRKRVSA